MYDSIRTVLFDFDGTLVFHEPDSFDIISAFLADIGQPVSEEAAYRGRRTRHAYFVDPAIREKLEEFSPDQFWQHFNRYLLEAMGVRGNLTLLAQEVTALFGNVQFVYHCPESGIRTLSELCARGYKLGLITNRDNVERFHELLRDTGLQSYFELILASGEIGIRKPEPGIFHAALERLGAPADQTVYVGDNYWSDVVGAQRAGVAPVLLDSQHLFPEADCLILGRIEELLEWFL